MKAGDFVHAKNANGRLVVRSDGRPQIFRVIEVQGGNAILYDGARARRVGWPVSDLVSLDIPHPSDVTPTVGPYWVTGRKDQSRPVFKCPICGEEGCTRRGGVH